MPKIWKFLLIILVILIFFGGFAGGFYYYFTKCRTAFLEEYSNLPVFDGEEHAKEIAKKNRWKYPLSDPKITKDEFLEKYKDACNELASQLYPASKLSAEIMKISAEYAMPENGDKIRFQLRRTMEKVEGVYRGTTDNTIQVSVNNTIKNYPFPEIMPEYQFLFNRADNDKIQREKIASLKKNYEEKRQEYIEKNRDSIMKKLNKFGYRILPGGDLVTRKEYIEQQLNSLKTEFEKEHGKKVKKLREKHSFLFVFQFTPPPETIEKSSIANNEYNPVEEDEAEDENVAP